MTVLVVEDTEDSRIMLRDVLESHGYSVKTAKNGAEALVLLQDIPEIIVSDILMPVMDGYEFCKVVKSTEEYMNVPFMFYTATYIEERDKALALSIGADYFLTKPQPHSTLLDIIRRVISGESMQPGRELDDASFNRQHQKVVSNKLDKKIRELEIERELLRRKEQQLRVITDSLPILISHVDSDYKYRYVNKGYELWHNKCRKDIIGHTVAQVNGEDSWKIIKHYLEQAMSGKYVDYESIMNFNNGEKRYVEVKYVPNLTEGGNVDGVIVLVNDITLQKKLKSEHDMLRQQLLQAQKMDAIGHLAGGIAHDFNNILASMLGYTELACDNLDPAQTKLRTYLEHVLQSGARARDLVSQMLAFSKGESSDSQPLDLNIILHDIVSFVDTMLPSSITIHFHSDGKQHYINSNIVQLQQLVLNLCINARDALNGCGSIQIALSEEEYFNRNCVSCNYPVSGRYIALSVADNGAGVSKENISRIFEPFYTTKDIGEGSGMGLSVIHGVMHEYHGHILLDCEPGEKTCFTLLFPVSDFAVEMVSVPAIQHHRVTNEKINIMVVDDEIGVSNFLVELLEFHGYGVKTFSNSNDALDYFSIHPDEFTVVITDYTMPGMDGVCLAEKLKQLNQDVKIFLCTGLNPGLENEKLGEQYISAYLNKPFTSSELLNNLRHALPGRH